MTHIDRTPGKAELDSRALPWLSGITVLAGLTGAVILGLTGHTALAMPLFGAASLANGSRLTVNIRKTVHVRH